SASAATKSPSRCTSAPRAVAVNFRHSPSNADFAAATARSTSSLSPRGMSAHGAAVKGLTDSKHAPEAESTQRPLISIRWVLNPICSMFEVVLATDYTDYAD